MIFPLITPTHLNSTHHVFYNNGVTCYGKRWIHIHEVTANPLQDLEFSQQSCWGFSLSGMWHYVVGQGISAILKTRTSFIFNDQVQSNLGSRTPRIMNNSVYEQIFRTQSVSDDVLCLELRTCKPSTETEKRKRIPFHFTSSPPSTYAINSPSHHLPLTPSTLLLTTFHLRRQLSSIPVR